VSSVRSEVQAAQVVIVADRVEPELVCCVLDQALGGLLLTDMPAADVARSLEQIAHGNTVLPIGWQTVLAANRSHPVHSLSERQREVLVLLAEGSSYAEIAARLFISQNTVKFHLRSIFSRLGVRNRVAAAHVLADAIK
jgi:two-component system nitrate/nitrite response regulator NarP